MGVPREEQLLHDAVHPLQRLQSLLLQVRRQDIQVQSLLLLSSFGNTGVYPCVSGFRTAAPGCGCCLCDPSLHLSSVESIGRQRLPELLVYLLPLSHFGSGIRCDGLHSLLLEDVGVLSSTQKAG